MFAAEIDWQLLLKHYLKSKVLYKELPLYPEVKRDLALLLDENVTFADIRKAAFAAERKLLRKVVLFDVYRGDKIPAGKKQYAVSLTLQDYDKTLTDKNVEQAVTRILNALSHQFASICKIRKEDGPPEPSSFRFCVSVFWGLEEVADTQGYATLENS